MHDAGIMRRFERLGELSRDRKRLIERQRPVPNAIGELVAIDELHHQGDCAARLLETVNLSDVRMIERRQRAGFAFETGEALGIVGERLGEDFDRDVTPEASVARAIDLTHSPGTERANDFVHAEARADWETHPEAETRSLDSQAFSLIRQGPVKAVGAAIALSSLQASRDFMPVNEPFRSRRPYQSERLWPFNDFH
jgi:hypothetical protein